MRNTLLHEISHALSPSFRDPRSGNTVSHGDAWRAKFVSIGGNGKRCGENPYYRAVKAEQLAANAPSIQDMVRVQRLKRGDMASIHLPNSKHHGFTGVVVAVTDKKIHIQSAGGKLMAPKSIVRPA